MPKNLVRVEDDVLEAAAELVSEASMSSLDESERSSESLAQEMVKAIQTLAIEKASASHSRSYSRSRAETSESSEDDSSVSFGAMWASRSPAKHTAATAAATVAASSLVPRVKAPRKLSLNGSGGSASASASGDDKVEISKSELKELEKMCDMLSNVLHNREDVCSTTEQIKIKLENL